jgi:cell division protease FtsH
MPPFDAPPPHPPNGPGAPQRPRPPWKAWLFLAVLLCCFGVFQAVTNRREAAHPIIPYSAFYRLVETGAVERVTLQRDRATGKLRGAQTVGGRELTSFATLLPAHVDEKLLPLMRDKKVEITAEDEAPSPLLQALYSILPWVLIVGVWIWMSRRTSKMMMGGGPFGAVARGGSRRFDKEAQVAVRFDDVAGLKAPKRDLDEIVSFLREPERFRRLGGRVPRGVLLVGPPGTGKTLLARAVAGESGVPFFSISGSEFIEMFVGVGASRVRELFAEAKKVAPSIIFIDEVDAVGRSRGAGLGGGHDEREQTLNQLLSEMDGFLRNDLVVVIAATNRPDVLDSALLRPGRFDRRVLVDRPELASRKAILEVHARGKPLGDDADLAAIAANTPGFSGADLANLVNEAALSATRRGAEAIERPDFRAAYDKIVLGDPSGAMLDEVEKRRVIVHEAGHAIVAHFTPNTEPLDRVSVLPRGMALGVTQQTPAGDRHIVTQPELEARLGVLMGGYAAERVVLGHGSSGAESDLKKATELAFKMVAHYGMSDRAGPIYVEHRTEHPFLGQVLGSEGSTSDATVRLVEQEAGRILVRAVEAATATIREHRAALDALFEHLLTHETAEREELLALLGPAVAPIRGPRSDSNSDGIPQGANPLETSRARCRR